MSQEVNNVGCRLKFLWHTMCFVLTSLKCFTNIPLEPKWEGHVTLEFSNATPLPAKIYANEGVAQMLVFEPDEISDVSYGHL